MKPLDRQGLLLCGSLPLTESFDKMPSYSKCFFCHLKFNAYHMSNKSVVRDNNILCEQLLHPELFKVNFYKAQIYQKWFVRNRLFAK